MKRVAVVASLLLASTALATGHGPVYALATPTLGENAWSLDVSAMYRLMGDVGDSESHMAMLRPMLGYGITEDLQVSVSAPMPVYNHMLMAPSRMMAMMPGSPDAEALLSWRFHRQGTDVGSRFESTALLGFDYPIDAVRNGVRTSPGIVAGAVTGYASRTIYAWAGALYRRYMSPTGPATDHIGDVLMYSAVVGYRPPFFRKELPSPDWRVFVEALAEYTWPDRVVGREVGNSGGHQVFVAPTLLGLYGPWGISGGPAFPVYSSMRGTQRADRVRFVVNYTYWF
jgi:hypothetical protein